MVGTMLGGVALAAAGEVQAGEAEPARAVLERLRRENRQALVSFSVALHAARRNAFDVAALAIARCSRQLHDIQRQEALHLYPVIARRLVDDADTTAAVTAMRRDANAHVRHFLRLVDGLFTRSRPGMPSVALIEEAEHTLSAYFAGKEGHVYRFYALAADGAASRNAAAP